MRVRLTPGLPAKRTKLSGYRPKPALQKALTEWNSAEKARLERDSTRPSGASRREGERASAPSTSSVTVMRNMA